MKIGVLSDTHARTLGEIPASIVRALAKADLIVHAGNFTEIAVLDGLQTLGEVKAVCGNMDSPEVKGILPEKMVFAAGGKKIGLVHGSGGPWGIADRVRKLFGDVDIIIYGHSHRACNQYVQGSLMINPGQARASFGMLTINKDTPSKSLDRDLSTTGQTYPILNTYPPKRTS